MKNFWEHLFAYTMFLAATIMFCLNGMDGRTIALWIATLMLIGATKDL